MIGIWYMNQVKEILSAYDSAALRKALTQKYGCAPGSQVIRPVFVVRPLVCWHCWLVLSFYSPIERSRWELSIGIVLRIAQINSSLIMKKQWYGVKRFCWDAPTVLYNIDCHSGCTATISDFDSRASSSSQCSICWKCQFNWKSHSFRFAQLICWYDCHFLFSSLCCLLPLFPVLWKEMLLIACLFFWMRLHDFTCCGSLSEWLWFHDWFHEWWRRMQPAKLEFCLLLFFLFLFPALLVTLIHRFLHAFSFSFTYPCPILLHLFSCSYTWSNGWPGHGRCSAVGITVPHGAPFNKHCTRSGHCNPHCRSGHSHQV